MRHNVQIQRALNISDYDCAERRLELEWLAVQARTRKMIVEVGSYKGCTARAMADNTTGLVHCVDTFQGSDEVDMKKILAEHPTDWLYETFKTNVADLQNIVVHKMQSIEAAELFAQSNTLFDMIFLDASHDFSSIRSDILAWRNLLQPGGLLCGHDRQWDGVSQALQELIPNHQVGIGAIWYQP